MANYNDYAAYDNEDEEEGSYGLNDSVLSQMQGYQFPNQGTPGREYDILNQAKQFSDNYEKKYYKDAITGQEKNAEHRYLNDFLNAVGERTLQLPGVIAGMADIPAGIVGFDRPFGKMADAVGEATGYTKWAKEAPVYSPGLQKDKQEIEKAWEQYDAGEASTLDLVGKYLQNPTVVTDIGAKTIPDLMLMGGLGAVPRVGAAAAEGAVMAGSAMDSMGESVEDPRLRAATAAGIGLLGAGVTKASKALADKAGVIDPDTLVTRGYAATRKEAEAMLNNSRGIGTRLAIGGGIEAGEELAQSTEETILQNLAEGKPWDENLRRNQVEGAIGGGLLGSIMNAPGPIRGQALPGQEDTLRYTPDEPSGNVGSETPSDGPVLDPNAGPMQRAASKSAEVSNKVEGLPNLPGDEVLNFRDGSTATRAEMEAYLTEQGMSPEQIDAYIRSRAEGREIGGIGQLEQIPIDEIVTFKDGSTARKSEIINNLMELGATRKQAVDWFNSMRYGKNETEQEVHPFLRNRYNAVDQISGEAPGIDSFINADDAIRTQQQNDIKNFANLSRITGDQEGFGLGLQPTAQQEIAAEEPQLDLIFNRAAQALTSLENIVAANPELSEDIYGQGGWADELEYYAEAIAKSDGDVQAAHINDLTITLDALDRAFESNTVVANEQTKTQSQEAPTGAQQTETTQQVTNDQQNTQQQPADAVAADEQELADRQSDAVPPAQTLPDVAQPKKPLDHRVNAAAYQILNADINVKDDQPISLEDAVFEVEVLQDRLKKGKFNKDVFAQSGLGRRLGTGELYGAKEAIDENPEKFLNDLKDRLNESARYAAQTLPDVAQQEVATGTTEPTSDTTAPNINDPKYRTEDGQIDLEAYDKDEAEWYANNGGIVAATPVMSDKDIAKVNALEKKKDNLLKKIAEKNNDTRVPPPIRADSIKKWSSKVDEIEAEIAAITNAGRSVEPTSDTTAPNTPQTAAQNTPPIQNNYLAEKGFTESEIAELENARKTTKNLNSYARGRFQERAVGVDFEKGWVTNENTQPVTPQNEQVGKQVQQQDNTDNVETEQQWADKKLAELIERIKRNAANEMFNYGGKSLKPAAIDYVDKIIDVRRRLTDEEISELAKKHGVPNDTFIQMGQNGGYGIEYILYLAQTGDIAGKAFFQANDQKSKTDENTQPVTPQNAQGDNQAQQQTDTLGNNTEQQGGLANVVKTPEKAVEQPWTDNKEDTDRWFGSRVEIAPQYKNESAEYGSVERILKGMTGPVIEVKIDGTDSTFRYRPDQLKVVSIVDNEQIDQQDQETIDSNTEQKPITGYYNGNAKDGSAAEQMRMQHRGSQIALLKMMNNKVGEYSNDELDNIAPENIEAVRDYLIIKTNAKLKEQSQNTAKGKAPNKKKVAKVYKKSEDVPDLLRDIRNLKDGYGRKGINRDELIESGADERTANGTNAIDPRLANKNGISLDDAATLLAPKGYDFSGHTSAGVALGEQIIESLGPNGKKIFTPENAMIYAELKAKEDEETREYEAEQMAKQQASPQEDLLSSYSKEDIEAKQQRIKDANAKEAAEKQARDQKYDSDQSLNTIVDEMLGGGVSNDIPGMELNSVGKAQDNTTEAETTDNEKLSEQELGDLFDNIFAEETSKRQPKQTQPQEVETKQGQPQKTRTATESAKSAAANTVKGLDNAINGLGALFGGRGTLRSGLTFDEDTYEQAKPYFIEAVKNLKNAGNDIKDVMRAIVKMVLDRFGPDVTNNMKPYVVRFVNDYQEGKINVSNTDDNLESDSANTNAQDSGNEKTVSDERTADGTGTGSTSRGTEGTEDGAGGNSSSPINPAATGRKRSNKPVHSTEQPTISSELPPGVTDSERGGNDSNAGIQAGLKASDAIKALAQPGDKKATTSKVKTADAENIAATLPVLDSGQKSDVLFAEKRLAEHKGVMFTNGTGTGKTFTALGIVKRSVMQGKDNIIIVVPSKAIANQWTKAASKFFDLKVKTLPDTRSSGKGVVITTYANFGDNNSLVNREWDMVVADESHYFMSNEEGDVTKALESLRGITYHREGFYPWFNRKHADLVKELKDSKFTYSDDMMDRMLDALRKRESDAIEAHNKALEKARVDYEALKTAKEPKVVFLSATPFPHTKDVDYAEGYLFDYGTGERGAAYNSGSNKDSFFIQNFGFRMRYNKLTKPAPEVDTGIMARQFNTMLRKTGALSFRGLDVDFDYDRKFLLVDSAIGQRIDQALEWIREKRYRALSNILEGQFDFLERRYLLEAIKANEAVKVAKDHIAQGRKVIIFHDYKKGGTTNPFIFYPEEGNTELNDQIAQFEEEFSDVINSFARLNSPIDAFKKAFGDDALIYNGSVSDKERISLQEQFNDDDSGKNIILVQSASAKEGVSFHDTTGKHQRVLINIGLPTQPATAIQQEGRIYRVGQASDAIFRYMNTGTNWERWAFANTIAHRASNAENLAVGEGARALKDAFINAFQESDEYPAGHEGEGKGGKEYDKALIDSLTEFDRAKTLYYGQGKKTSRNKSAEGQDYYATPEPIGYIMAKIADARPGESMLEPSAGHGAIARWFREDAKRTAIEPSGELSSRLALNFESEVKRQTFEELNIINKYDAIVMNPPFGAGGKTAIEHLDKAFKHLRMNGRIVALIPEGPAADNRFEKWLYDNENTQEAQLIANISLPTVTFERAGTKVKSRIVVIDKMAPEDAQSIQTQERDYSSETSINNLFDRIEDISISPRVIKEPDIIEKVKEQFEPIDVLNTRTKNYIFTVKPKEFIKKDKFKIVHEIAKANKGKYISKAETYEYSFSFLKEEDRDSFYKALSQSEMFNPNQDSDIKFSVSGKDSVAENQPKPIKAPHTAGSLRSTIGKIFGKGWTNGLFATGKFKLISKAEARQQFGIQQPAKGRVQGFYDPKTDTTYLVYDNISRNMTKTDLEGVIKHEIAVHALKLGQEDKVFQKIVDDFVKLAETNKLVKEAVNRVPAGTKQEHRNEEALAYYIEKNPTLPIAKRLLTWFRVQLRKIAKAIPGLGKAQFAQWANNLTADDIVYMATRALKAAPDTLVFDNTGVTDSVIKKAREEGYEGNDRAEGAEWLRAVAKGLDMSKEARMQRARDMGFDVDTVWYKGMYPYGLEDNTKEVSEIKRMTEFPAFNKGEKGINIAGFFSDNKYFASDFANKIGTGSAVYPVYLKSGRELEIDATDKMAGEVQFGESGKFFRDEVRSGKYDSVLIKNTKDEGNVKVVLNSNQVRSIHAAFDPDYKDSGNLLASKEQNDIDKAYFDALNKGDMEEVQRLVDDAAVQSGAPIFGVTDTTGFRVRRKKAPKKTVTVYKTFRMKDGKLYPMFVGAKDELPVGVWIDATEGGYHFTADNGREYIPADTGISVSIPNDDVRSELLRRGYIKSPTAKSIKVVAYRPGWHGGELPFFPQSGTKVVHKGKKLLKDVPDNYPYPNVHLENTVLAEVEMDADYNYEQEYKDTAERNKDGSINKTKSGLRFIPEGGYYEYATNPLFQDRPDLGKWYISGSVKINRILTQKEVNSKLDELEVPRQLWEKGDKLNLDKLGYDPQFNHTSYKLTDPVTYDNDGNIIPLSERFNLKKKDVRYSFAKRNQIYISDAQWRKEISNLYYNNDDKTRGIVVSMSPDEFLELASDSMGQAEERADEYGMFDAEKFTSDWLPTLDIDASGKVQDHEGRARAVMAERAGIKEIPVILRLPKADRISSVDKAPKTLTAQDSNKRIKVSSPRLVSYSEKNPFPESQYDGDGIKYSFAGEKSKVYNKEALAKAKAMEADGKTPREIWDETGFFKAPWDNKWRYEIDDASSIKMGVIDGTETSYRSLGNTISHKGWEKHYPDMKGMEAITKVDSESVEKGSYSPEEKGNDYYFGRDESIEVIADTEEKLRELLLHEGQHAIQHREGFAIGGNPFMFDEEQLAKEKSRLYNSIKQELIPQLVREYRAETDPEIKKQIAQAKKELDKYAIAISKMSEADMRMEKYKMLAGEAEARLVQKRMDMTPEQRRAYFPLDHLRDMLREEGLAPGINFDALGVIMAPTGQDNASDIMFSVADDNTPDLESERRNRKYEGITDAVKSAWRNLSKAKRKAQLAVLSLRQITEIGNDLFKGIPREVQRAKDKLDAKEQSIIHKASLIYERGKNLPKAERDSLADIAHLATFSQVSADPEVEFEETGKNDKERFRITSQLRKRFKEELSDEGRKLYRDMRDFYKERDEERNNAIKDRIEEDARAGLLSKSITEKFIITFEVENRLSGDYFPLTRFGDFWLHYKDSSGEPVFMTFDTKEDARDEIARLNLQEGEYSLGMNGERIPAMEGVDPRFIDSVNKIIDGVSQSEEATQLKDAIYQKFLETLPALSSRKSYIHRKNRLGYQDDIFRAFAHKSVREARQNARLIHGKTIRSLISDMEKAAKMSESIDKMKEAELTQQAIMELEEFEWTVEDIDRMKDYAEGDTLRKYQIMRKYAVMKENAYDFLDIASILKTINKQIAIAKHIKSGEDGDFEHAENIVQELKDFYANIMNSNVHPITQLVNSIGFSWFLGASPAAAFMNSMQVPSVSIPYMSAEFGMGRTTKAFKQAYLEFIKGERNAYGEISIEKSLKNSDEKAAFKEFFDLGLLSRTLTHDMMGAGDRGVEEYTGFRGVMNSVMGHMFQFAERSNREVTAMAAFRLKRDMLKENQHKNKLSDRQITRQAIDYAIEATYATHGDYNSTNRPRAFRGDVARVITQFKQYPQMITFLYYNTMLKAFNSYADEPSNRPEWVNAILPKQKRLSKGEIDMAKAQLRNMLIAQFAFAGTAGMPLGIFGLSALSAVLEMGLDDDDEPFDLDAYLRKQSTEFIGETPTKFLARGLGGALTLFQGDLHSRMSQSDLWIRDDDPDAEGKDAHLKYLKYMAGPVFGGVLGNILAGHEMMKEPHDWSTWRGLEKMAPKFIGDPMKGIRYAADDAKTLKGDLVEEIDAFEALIKALGLQPFDLADRYAQSNTLMTLQRRLSDRRTYLRQKAAIAKIEGNTEELRRIWEEEIKEGFNAKWEGSRNVPITMQDINATVKALKSSHKNTDHGIRLNDKYQTLINKYRYLQ